MLFSFLCGADPRLSVLPDGELHFHSVPWHATANSGRGNTASGRYITAGSVGKAEARAGPISALRRERTRGEGRDGRAEVE